MLEKQFESFLIELLISQKVSNIKPGVKYHFRCPDIENRFALVDACKQHLSGSIEDDGNTLDYIELGTCKLIYLAQDEFGEKGVTENYISTLRDKISGQLPPFENCALVGFHNSKLDTWINGSKNLSTDNNVWDPQIIVEQIKMLFSENQNKDLSECLLDYKFEVIKEERSTIFGFTDIYNSLKDGNIDFNKLELFKDERILNFKNNKKQMSKRLEDNRRLFKRVNNEILQFEKIEDRLLEFRKSFRRKHFVNTDKWKDTEYQTFLDEISANKEKAIEFSELTSENKSIVYRTRSQKAADSRRLHVLIPIDDNSHEFGFKLAFKGTDIENSQVQFDKSSGLNESNFKLRSSDKNQFIHISGPIKAKPFFFRLSIKRDKSSESHTFSCLVIDSAAYGTDDIETKFTIDVGKKCLTIHTESSVLNIGKQSSAVKNIKNNNEVVDLGHFGKVDYSEFNEVTDDELLFSANFNGALLKFKIDDEVANQALFLPVLLDKSRFNKMFKSPGGRYVSKKVVLDNKEIKPTGIRLDLLEKEAVFISNAQLTLGYSENVFLTDIESIEPALHKAYQNFFEYLDSNKLLPSLSYWEPDFAKLVADIINCYSAYLLAIRDASTLDQNIKTILSIGMVLNEDGIELMSPYHPLVLSYYLHLTSKLSSLESTFQTLPDVTISRLNPRGLLPFVYSEEHDYCNSECFDENQFWLKHTPYEECSFNYVKALVQQKINDFKSTFSDLFNVHSQAKLHINSINNGSNREIFLGLTEYFKKQAADALNIHVNIYDDELTTNYFDEFSELRSYDDVGKLLNLPPENKSVLIDLMRSKLTYSKFTNDKNDSRQEYAHISFFYNHEKVTTTQVDINKMPGGVAADAILSGEAIKIDNQIYYSQLGLAGIDVEMYPHITLARLLNTLMYPWKADGERYFKGKSRALKIGNSFRDSLEKSYNSSVWTTVIDPKVTLEFFNTEGTLLLHYSDQYTSSAGYDAVTVTKKSELYQKALRQNGGGNVSEFSAFNGEWLLKMLNHEQKTQKSRLEKTGIVGAYKLVFEMLYRSDITWVPLSVAEIIRVSGNIGLKMDDSEFSRNVNGYKKGAISDDILFVGFKDSHMYLLPVEVKTGQRPDYQKAVAQAKELRRYLVEDILGPVTFEGQLYRSLFVRQLVMQIEKYQMYDIFPKEYFEPIVHNKEKWLDGTYVLGQIKNYPEGMVVAHVSNGSCVQEDIKLTDKVLKMELPIALLNSMLDEPLKEVLNNRSLTKLCNVKKKYILDGATHNLENDNAKSNKNTPVEVQGDIEVEQTKQLPPQETPSSKIHVGESSLQLSDKRILIGKSSIGNEDVYWEYGNPELPNRHMVIFGGSGEGKTYCIQGLLMELGFSNIHSLVVDYTNGYLPEHLEKEFVDKSKPSTHWVVEKPLSINPFLQHSHNINGRPLKEKPHIVAGRVASVFNSVYSSIGEQQLPTLTNVIEEGIKLFEGDYSFRKMINDLVETGKVGELLANKLSTMVKSDLFDESSNSGWDNIYSDTSLTNIIQLTQIPNDLAKIATEFILWDLYAYAVANGNKNSPLPVVLDEVQNLDHRLDSPLGKILTEGRKYGLSLILATQTLSNLAREEQDRLFQASHKLFFAPAKTEIKRYAEILTMTESNSTQKEWIEVLNSLKKGQCLSVGYHLNSDNQLEIGVKKVHVASLNYRISNDNN